MAVRQVSLFDTSDMYYKLSYGVFYFESDVDYGFLPADLIKDDFIFKLAKDDREAISNTQPEQGDDSKFVVSWGMGF